ncbi:hypothetical protein SAMN05720764_10184 [Fibrobacter sp. UWH5]|uniref:hypothetical protein n=1 Tax=Fibrobacter sp. UWH5 TaxID=1896211 RepID=UPI00091360A5|nr:hypothetical protein [Fibrobacter sp. UWH5]SHK29305.1 hypothetical protein SAMN05720764_10184 [Fibrobacter sp. UWH5]
MSRILYPIIATALVTIAPFLLTFEKGQNVVHGLLCYSIFGLLLLFVYVRESQAKSKKVCLALIAVLVAATSFLDLKNILSANHGNLSWYWIIPLVSTAIAIVLLKETRKISLNGISFIMFVSMGVNIVAANFFPSQPVFEMPVLRFMTSSFRAPSERIGLTEDLKKRYNAVDSAMVSRLYVDSSRNNVMILVESWGIPIDTNFFNDEMKIFEGCLNFAGTHSRIYSRTRGAEREDLVDSIIKNENGSRDSVFIPAVLSNKGFKSVFMFGGDSSIQHRDRYIHRMGFDEVVFTKEISSDSVIALKIDSMLKDSTSKTFVAWTTRDTQFPMGDDAATVEKIYFEKMFNTLKIVAELAKKHPETRFIVQGDHEPILSPQEFRQKFYRRWVPYVVLN